MINLNHDVTTFLDGQKHPLRTEIEKLRNLILSVSSEITENIKWNGPNYCFCGEDRITMRIHPPKQIQLIFHRGAKVKSQPQNRLIQDKTGLLIWKENDRAVATFKTMKEIEASNETLKLIVSDWIQAAK